MKNKKILMIILLGTVLLGTILFNPKPAYAVYKPFGGWILIVIPVVPPTIPPIYMVTIGPPRGGVFKFIQGISQSLSGRILPIPGFPTLGISFGGIILYLW